MYAAAIEYEITQVYVYYFWTWKYNHACHNCVADQDVANSSQVPLHFQLAWLVQNLAGHDQHGV